MTDSEKFDLILAKLEKLDSLEGEMQDIKSEMQDIKKDVSSLRRQGLKSTAELKAMDELILDEVERVHGILDAHKSDKAAHTA